MIFISYCFIAVYSFTYFIEYCNYFEIFIIEDNIENFVCSKFMKGNN